MNTRLPALFAAVALAFLLAAGLGGGPAASPCDGYGVCVAMASR